MRFSWILACLACSNIVTCLESAPSRYDAAANDGAKASTLVKNHEHGMFELVGSGFKPYESIYYVSHSGDEVLSHFIETDEKGELPMIMLLPAVIGKSSGVCRVSLFRKDGPIHIKFPWSVKET